MGRLLFILVLVAAVGCASRERAPGGVIVDMKGVDRTQYQVDLADCSQYADQVDVAGKTATGAVGGAVVGGAVGAVLDDRSVGEGAGVGAILGGSKGVARGVAERQRVVKNCLRGRGYRVLN